MGGGSSPPSFMLISLFLFSFFFFLFFQRNFPYLHFSFPPTKQNLNSYQSKLTLGEAAWLHSYYVTLEEQISIHRQLLGFFFQTFSLLIATYLESQVLGLAAKFDENFFGLEL